MAQGRKEVVLGTERYRYDAARYLLVSAGLPLVGHVIEASKDQPYLALGLTLDPGVVTAVLIESGRVPSRPNGDVRAVSVSTLDASLLDAVVRLVRLLDSPDDYRVLARVYRADGTETTLDARGVLDGEDVLPGFSCALVSMLG